MEYHSGIASRTQKLRIGPLVVGLSADHPQVTDDIFQLYDHYPVVEQQRLSDFDIVLRAPNPLRRFIRSQVQFFLDGIPPFEPMPVALGATMFESAINWCVYSRIARYLILHASVVEKDGKALIFPGFSGSGKSTLCAALVGTGWRLLSDEFTMICPRTGLIQPHPRPISLKNDGIDLIRERLPNANFSRRFRGTTKGTLCFMKAPENSVLRGNEPATPVAICALNFDPKASGVVKPVDKADAFMSYIGHSCNYYSLCAEGFEAMANLVDHCSHYEFIYRDLDQAIEIIEEVFDQSRKA